MQGARSVYVISDLHIGGRYGNDPGDRGFRMCTHVDALQKFVEQIVAEERPRGTGLELVINGDFIDFLAEGDVVEQGAGGPGRSKPVTTWKPVIHSSSEAVRKLADIVRRDRGFFDALGKLLAGGHALTVLLGNHDVELSYPAVHEALRGHLGATGGSAFRFIYDDEAYSIGDALIEHGNRYDVFNRIDHDALRQARAMQSRGEPTDDGPFKAPPGSRLVAFIMNPIKAQYPFVDLLKPETESVLPIVAALAPSVRWKLPNLLWLAAEASFRRDIGARMDDDVDEPRGVDIAERADDDVDGESAPLQRRRRQTRRGREREMLRELLSRRMTEAGADDFLRKLAVADEAEPGSMGDEEGWERGRDIASPSAHILRLLGSFDPRGLKARLPALLDSLRVVQNDRSFNPSVETDKDYLDGAQKIADRGRKHVVFGHTHLAKEIPLTGDATYYNTGTWADLIEFPKKIFEGNEAEALAELWIFVDDLEHGRLAKHILFKPSYVRLDVKGHKVERAGLHFWNRG